MYALDLSLKHEWFNMIAAGRKSEEYRDFRPYYANRLLYHTNLGQKEYWDTIFANMKNAPYYKPQHLLRDYGARRYDAVRFHKGQGGKQTMLFEFAGLEIGKGRPEWGAPDEDVFIIKLGRRIG